MSAPLVVVHAGNSQGKTSLAEAMEFLLTGRSSRRDVFGGAKAEYNASLRNAHLPENVDVWVAAGIRNENGTVSEVRRTLTADFGSASDCASTLTVDGVEHEQLPELGLSLGDGVMGAPVLLQHTLRYVLSTEPKQRATYFKALLSLSDLDLLRQRVAAHRAPLEQVERGPGTTAVEALRGTALDRFAKVLIDIDTANSMAQATIEAVLISAGQAIGVSSQSFAELTDALGLLSETRADKLFPISGFTAKSTLPDSPVALETSTYIETLDEIDQKVANLLPMLSAVLTIPAYEHLDSAADCPVCGTSEALTPARIDIIKAQVSAGTNLDIITARVNEDIRVLKGQWVRWREDLSRLVPQAVRWTPQAVEEVRDKFYSLCGDDMTKLTAAFSYIEHLDAARQRVDGYAQQILESLNIAEQAIVRRLPIDTGAGTAFEGLQQARDDFLSLRDDDKALKELEELIYPLLDSSNNADGLKELRLVVERSSWLIDELRQKARRADTLGRLNSVDRALKKASAGVLDSRFAEMSETIEKWWLSIRPDELVGFSGVKRRAAGAVFVNLVAALQPQAHSEAVERDALGVYSDSQLNALGLSTFLARAELANARTLVLDDPIPGSDGDHRLTFVQNTLGDLLAAGKQVILTTYDPKLADWAASMHITSEPITYELNLLDATLGTEPTQTSDAFSRFMLQAEDNLSAPTAAGRRGACNAYRSAAERLAKQIIATNRSEAGIPTTVADVTREAPQLGELIPLVRGFALADDEGGKWTVMPRVLNPGSHDDDVASTLELKQIRGNLRSIAKMHKKRWGDALVV